LLLLILHRKVSSAEAQLQMNNLSFSTCPLYTQS
jgi:uncharacterized protein YlaN (UPF0358 family)